MHQVIQRDKQSRTGGLASGRLAAALRFPFGRDRDRGLIDVRLRSPFRVSPAKVSLIACVALPGAVAFTYFALVASYQYLSEAKIAVRSNIETQFPIQATSSTSSSDKSSVPQQQSGSIFTRQRPASQEAYIVADYIRSRTIIEDIGGKKAVMDIFARSGADWFSRLSRSAPLEDVHTYWKGQVTATIDTLSSVITVQVRAFSPAEAKELAELVMNRSERLVNELSERSRRDALTRAEGEVDTARARLRKAQDQVTAFRNRTSIVDPKASATSIGELIVQLTREKLKLENDRAAMVGIIASDSPTQRVLNAQIEAMNKQIVNLQEQLTSETQRDTMSGQIANYEDVQLEALFAEKLYSIAQSAYEKARIDQERQQLYVVTIVRPTLAEQSFYPRVLADTGLLMFACFVLWGMIALVIASVRDHAG